MMRLLDASQGATALSLCIFAIYLTPVVHSAVTDGKLRMVHLVYRHGIRAPEHFYPTDKFQEKDWRNGVGHLTQKGMTLEYELGKFLKYRYVRTKFINSSYLHKEVYIRSSDKPRCLQSAQAQLAGLYPPEGWQLWNKDIAWQPVPVHTVSVYDDPLLRPFTNCPRISSKDPEVGIWRGREVSEWYLKDVRKNQPLLDKINAIARYDKMVPKVTLNYDNLWWIQDCMRSEEAEGFLPLDPPWPKEIRDPMFVLADRIFGDRWKGDDEMARLTGGPILARMIDHMKRWTLIDGVKGDEGANKDLYKFNLYSGHDQSIMAVACALNVSIPIPLFASSIMIELYSSPTIGWYVEVNFRNDYNYDNFTKLKLDGCDFQCPLDKFIELNKNRVSVDRRAECWNDKDKVKPGRNPVALKILLGVFITLSLVFLTVIVILCYNRKNAQHHPVYDDETTLQDSSS